MTLHSFTHSFICLTNLQLPEGGRLNPSSGRGQGQDTPTLKGRRGGGARVRTPRPPLPVQGPVPSPALSLLTR